MLGPVLVDPQRRLDCTAAQFYSSLFGLGKPVPFGPFLDEINTHFGGRGVYFEDPGGHLLEIITRPYGSGS